MTYTTIQSLQLGFIVCHILAYKRRFKHTINIILYLITASRYACLQLQLEHSINMKVSILLLPDCTVQLILAQVNNFELECDKTSLIVNVLHDSRSDNFNHDQRWLRSQFMVPIDYLETFSNNKYNYAKSIEYRLNLKFSLRTREPYQVQILLIVIKP